VNNIASSLAEQRPLDDRPPNFLSFQEQALLWAEKAVAVAESIPAADRTDECTSGCATAKANMAELAERGGRLSDALALFKEAERLAKTIGFKEGEEVASSGRKRVHQTLNPQG
jgi:hypothetical protein